MAYWLIKSEPETFSWADQIRNDVEPWTGVRNYQARNNLAAMKAGDRALFYHSVSEKRIVGVVKVVREAYPDPTADDPRWVCVDVKADGTFCVPVTLTQIKETDELQDMALLKQSRLSVAPVREEEFEFLVRVGKWSAG